ncbi:Retrovirus-related Pol polyprotein from transposon TNT 1-94 [Bienertia sinuspersici]
MAADSGERIESLIYTVTFAADTHTTISFYEFLPSLLILLSYSLSPVSKCVTEVISEIGLRHLQFLSEIIPALSTVWMMIHRQLRDKLLQLALIFFVGFHASKLDDSSESTWEWILKFKGKIYSVAFESRSGGRRLLALKFVPVIILIYTPDPNGGTELPPHLIGDVVGKEVGFNISWIRRGHPMLKLGDLSVEAS